MRSKEKRGNVVRVEGGRTGEGRKRNMDFFLNRKSRIEKIR